jgi:flagellar hook-length control protein FliK
MINFNFLGIGSFSGIQQKQKKHGVESADGEHGPALLLDAEAQKSDAAFPDVLMQLILGQQIPVIVPPPSGQQPAVSGADIEGEALVPVKPLFTNAQPAILQEPLFSGESLKQPVSPKTSVKIPVSGVINIASLNNGIIETAKLPLEELNAESVAVKSPKNVEGTEPASIATAAKLTFESMAVLPAANPQSGSVLKEKSPETAAAAPSPVALVSDVNVPKQTKLAEVKIPAKETKNAELPRKTLPPENGPAFKDVLVRSDADVPASIPDTKFAVLHHKSQRNEAANRASERVLTPNDEVQQKEILATVATLGGKAVKIITGESAAIDKQSTVEKNPLSASSGTAETPAVTAKNETQNSGNGSFTQKENMDHQRSSEKEIAPAATRQGQQAFASTIEEKNNVIVSKSRQAEVTTILRQQDTVNNIFEQLAKNVTVSIDGNNSQMKISLKPEALGEVMLKVTIEQGKVSTQMEVQQPQVKAVIEANLQILRESLSSKGLVVDRIDISTTQYSLNEKSSHQGHQRSNLKNYSGREIDEEILEQTKLFGYNTVDYIA